MHSFLALLPILLLVAVSLTKGVKPAVLAVSVVLLFDGLFSAFGAVGSPLAAGLQGPLGLAAADVKTIGLTAAILLSVAGLLVLWFEFRLLRRVPEPLAHRRQVLVL